MFAYGDESMVIQLLKEHGLLSHVNMCCMFLDTLSTKVMFAQVMWCIHVLDAYLYLKIVDKS